MSSWTYVNGIITVSPMGRTQAEKTYILETVLQHLPKVTGSEEDIYIHSFPKKGHNCSSNVDEFGQFSNTLPYDYFGRNLEMQDDYIIVVEGHFRDRHFEQTYKEFMKWLCRLAKRVFVDYVLVEVSGYDKHIIIRDNYNKFADMFEPPSWCDESQGEPTWCEYLMWQRMKDDEYPAVLGYKYYNDKDNDKRVEEWIYG